MKEFTRPPTKGERVLAIVLNSLLAVLFGSLSTLFAFRGLEGAAVVFGLATCVWIGLLCRAAFGTPRALRPKGTSVLAWIFLFLGLAGFALVVFVSGETNHRLMVLSGSVVFFSAGLVGIRAQQQDA